MDYIILFDKEDGSRKFTYPLDKDITDERKAAMLEEGYEIVDEDTFQLLIGNVDGKEYVKDPETGEFVPYVRKYTAEQIANIQQSMIESMTKQYLNTEAKALGYDDCLTACSYVDTGVTKYDEEGAAFRAWRSGCYLEAYSILEEIKAMDGATTENRFNVPEYDEFIERLPKFVCTYSTK